MLILPQHSVMPYDRKISQPNTCGGGTDSFGGLIGLTYTGGWGQATGSGREKGMWCSRTARACAYVQWQVAACRRSRWQHAGAAGGCSGMPLALFMQHNSTARR